MSTEDTTLTWLHGLMNHEKSGVADGAGTDGERGWDLVRGCARECGWA